MAKLYLLLGGNLGDKRQIFAETRNKINVIAGEIIAQSGIYETEPWGFQSDDLFWNQVLEVSTTLSPSETILITQKIELEMGRIRKSKQYDSRLIDIDILFYDNLIINLENLVIPHPRLQNRKFALVPLCEIAAELVHPVFNKTIKLLLAECADPLKVEKVNVLNI